ncbi:hypothetical protein D6D02_04579 [Aureobasidium pullulans]|nr:hypothetical protein D6D02_04579 [Aureobasidium pullulans]
MANTRPPDLATCEMLRKLMKSARDDHLTDPQIQFLSGTVTSANVEHNIKLLHKANKEKANKDKADKEKANKDEAQPRNPRPTVAQHGSAIKRQEHSLLYKHTLPVPSEAGAVICADTFERLNTEDIRALHKLINVCPFNLASQTCVHAKDCYLVRICSEKLRQQMQERLLDISEAAEAAVDNSDVMDPNDVDDSGVDLEDLSLDSSV